jgi:Calcineurin-like phosphoesterase
MARKINIPLKLNLTNGVQTVAVVADYHVPFHDPKTIRLVDEVLRDIQPEVLVYNGDLNDCYQISVFAKDPSRLSKLQKDIDKTVSILDRHNTILPRTQKILIEGNHEYRFQRFLWSDAPELSSLDSLTIPELYRLDQFGIDYIPYEQGLLINKVFLVLHGDIASIHSAYTAKRLFEKHGGCGMCNHTHRGGSFYKRDRFGTWGWWENFCLCSLNPDWIQNPNWQQGFSLIHFTDHSRFFVEQIPVIDHKILYRGELYR